MTPAPQAGAHTRVSSCAVHGAKSRSELGFQGRGTEFALIDHAFIVGRVEKQVGTEQTAYGRRCPGHIFLVLEQKRVVVDGLGIEALIGGMEHRPCPVDYARTGTVPHGTISNRYAALLYFDGNGLALGLFRRWMAPMQM